MPGLAYNPLFICGPPGLGKTHLLHSIANYVSEHGEGLTVRYTTVEAFTNQFVGALHTSARCVQGGYRSVDVLLVDDIQFLQSKAQDRAGVLPHLQRAPWRGRPARAHLRPAAARPRRAGGPPAGALRSRPGLRHPPARPGTRLTILRKRVLQDAIAGVDHEALEVIAARVDTNIRALEGALIRVVAFGSLTGRPVTHELAAEVLDGLYPELRPSQRTVREIQESTCEAFGISIDQLVSSSRAGGIAGRARSPCTSRAS